MKPENKVVSLETAKRLKAAGFPQDTERWWREDGRGNFILDYSRSGFGNYAAPDAQEIGEVLPKTVTWQGETLYLVYEFDAFDANIACVGYMTEDYDLLPELSWMAEKGNEAEARAACWLWLKENNLV